MSEYRSYSGNIPEHWYDAAEEMGVSTAEYVRRMARLGRRQWGHDHVEEPDNAHVIFDEQVTLPQEVSEIIGEMVKRNLSAENGLTETELTKMVEDDFQEQVNEQLEKLQEQGNATYSPSKGGWVFDD